ncbi:hypothetical protein ScPMuIL_007698 [Solemya velum]
MYLSLQKKLQSGENMAAHNDGVTASIGACKETDKKIPSKSKGDNEKIQAVKESGGKHTQKQKKGDSKTDKMEKQSSDSSQQKSKSELRRERREKQEEQRAIKANKKAESEKTTKKEPVRVPPTMKADDAEMQKRVAKKLEKQQIPQRTVVQRKVRLFNHLHQYERELSLTQSVPFSCGGIHPAIIKLGVQYADRIITGSNARCIALMLALKKIIEDYTTPPQKELSRDLEAKIKPHISFLSQCRPMSVSMGNAIKYLKWHISHIPREMSDSEAKQQLYDCIENFFNEKIMLAAKAISLLACEKIADGDVIVVYSCSSLIRKVLSDALAQGKSFRVIVVDGRPRLEAKEFLRRLVKDGIKCSYVLINAASYVMQEATKVLFGAHALLANGYVLSRVGSSLIALIAKSYNVPVLVCCETYKFCERVQTDSFVFNELDDPDYLVDIGSKPAYLCDWRDYSSLTLLNLIFDVTPPELISVVITELGLVPCTSVPVVLRMQQSIISEGQS